MRVCKGESDECVEKNNLIKQEAVCLARADSLCVCK